MKKRYKIVKEKSLGELESKVNSIIKENENRVEFLNGAWKDDLGYTSFYTQTLVIFQDD